MRLSRGFILFTGSAIDRVLRCPSSEALPHIHYHNEYAESGHARHKYLEDVSNLESQEAALARVPDEHREMCAGIDLAGLPVGLAAEVAFAYDWTTGRARELGRCLNRDYSQCTETEIVGTLDAIGVMDDAVYVGDYKGYKLIQAKNNAQLLFGGMCATKVYDKTQARLEIINLRNGKNWFSRNRVDIFDLGAFEKKLRNTIHEVQSIKSGKKPPEVREGGHCQYCPAIDHCPAKTLMLRNMLNGAEANELEMQAPLTKANASAIYKNYLLMKSITGRARELIYAYAADNPIDVDGKVLGKRVKEGNEALDGDIAYEAVRSLHGQEAADLAVSRVATKTSIDKMIRTLPRDGTLASMRRAIMDPIRSAGGISRKTSTVIDVHKPKKELK